eukprot:CAMPEP_0172306308 /NCGR_PEP_ID=MMETSP1058-20130122/7406_1 /TAXON_ID=83371 /ORGANISM="Detonula confervacea, Strain CCMP 353" /LENGTH=206 /DNA_ID=CAMNT_0013018149 /DNA_START=122 /DNA_END=742 /DNA_ORIENTATION=+
MTAGKSMLTHIDFSRNAISTGESTFISDFLESNPILEFLRLWRNRFVDEDANLFAKALKRNTNLKFLDLDENDLTDAGWDMLHKAEFDPTSLNSASDSNHTCHVSCHSKFNEGPDDSYHSVAVRQKKIYSLLSLRNRKWSNVQYFDDIPVELLPDMLSSIQQYSEYHCGENAPEQDDEDTNAFSIVFEVMRRWDESISVYEALSNC